MSATDQSRENIVLPVPDISSMDNEALAKFVVSEMEGVLRRARDLKPFYQELWRRFDALPKGGTISGCRTRTEFCERILHRTRRGVQKVLYEGNVPKPEPKPEPPHNEKKPFQIVPIILSSAAEREDLARLLGQKITPWTRHLRLETEPLDLFQLAKTARSNWDEFAAGQHKKEETVGQANAATKA